MSLKFRDKNFGWKRFFKSFKYSFEGLKYAYLHEQSLFVHFIVSVLAIALGFIFKISNGEWIVTISFLGIAMALELLNTSIEATVDMVTTKHNPLAKIAKDCSSAAVFVISMMGLVACLIIYVPKFMILF